MRPTEILMDEHRVIERVLDALIDIATEAQRQQRLDAQAAGDALEFFRIFADTPNRWYPNRPRSWTVVNRPGRRTWMMGLLAGMGESLYRDAFLFQHLAQGEGQSDGAGGVTV